LTLLGARRAFWRADFGFRRVTDSLDRHRRRASFVVGEVCGL